MLKDIKYKGINTEQSGYDATAGNLAVAHNVVNDHGFIEPLAPPKRIITYSDHGLGSDGSYGCVFKHEMIDGTVNYIFCSDGSGEFNNDYNLDYLRYSAIGSLKWLSATAGATETATEVTWKDAEHPGISAALYEVTAVGNTLCVLTSDGMDYFVWKNGTYKELGFNIPNVTLHFALKEHYSVSQLNDIQVNSITPPTGSHVVTKTIEESDRATVSDAIYGEISKVTGEALQEGYVGDPFFVRYAIRLFDGTLIKHSAPIFMYTSSPEYTEPYVGLMLYTDPTSLPQQYYKYFDVYYVCSELYCEAEAIDLSDWGDIISGVDIFMSKPQSRIRDDEQIKSVTVGYDDSSMSSLQESDYPSEVLNRKFSAYDDGYTIKNLYNVIQPTVTRHPALYRNNVVIPQRSIDTGEESIFYEIKKIKSGDLTSYVGSLTKIDLKDVLRVLEVQPIMEDDYHTHDLLVAQGAYAYNQRINLFNLKRDVVFDQNPTSFFQYLNKHNVSHNVTMYVKLDADGTDKWIQSESASMKHIMVENIRYVFYPDSHAKQIRLMYNNGVNDFAVTLNLEQHPSLNGSYWYSDTAAAIVNVTGEPAPAPVVSSVVFDEPNKIYTSEVGNPYYFPLGGINTIGTGKILSLAANTRAISQGQFGEFPLYVFTDNGIWMLKVDDKGLYKAKQPVSLDCVSAASKVTNVDDAVVYSVDRGLMMISGQNSKCISDELECAAESDPSTDLPSTLPGDTTSIVPTTPWTTFRQGAACVYDSINRRLHVFNPSYYFHYIYSLRTGTWSTIGDTIPMLYPINSRYLDTSLGLLDSTQNDTAANIGSKVQTILTRPVSFETDAYKRMRDNIQRGDIDKLRSTGRNVKVLLQGSNDLQSWKSIAAVNGHYRITGKSGTPYKWFRWKIVITSLIGDYKLHGLTADVDVTGNNKLR